MFDGVFLSVPSQEQAVAFYTLLSKTPGEVTGEEWDTARAALEQLNEKKPEGKTYRDCSVALSLYVLYRDGDEFHAAGFENAFGKMFPERAGDAGMVAGFAELMAGLKTILYSDLPGEVERLENMARGDWEPIYWMAKRSCLDIMLRIQDFASVKENIRKLSGDLVGLSEEKQDEIVKLRNEFGDL